LAKSNPKILHADRECLLWQCVKDNQVECVRFLLAMGASPNAAFRKYAYYDTETDQLYADNEDLDDESGSDESTISSVDSVSSSSSGGSVYKQDKELERMLFNMEDDNEQRKLSEEDGIPVVNPFSPLATAVRLGRADCLQLLLDHGADLERDPLGLLTLDAARRGHWSVLHLLLARGAEVAFDIPNESSVVEMVIQAASNEYVLSCVRSNNNSNAHSPEFTELYHIFRLLVEWGGCADMDAALRLSAELGILTFVRYMVELIGVSVTRQRRLVSMGRLARHVDVLHYLLEAGLCDDGPEAAPELRDILALPETRTPLHARLFLHYGANPHGDQEGRALTDCAMYGSLDVLRVLVDEGNANLYRHFRAVFRRAVEYAQPHVIKFLLSRSAVPVHRLLDPTEEVQLRCTGESNVQLDYADVYMSLEEGVGIIRVRASFGSFRVTDAEFEAAVAATQTCATKAMHELVRAAGGCRLTYWLEDTLVREVVV
jgi:hypothetical protein